MRVRLLFIYHLKSLLIRYRHRQLKIKKIKKTKNTMMMAKANYKYDYT
jgi:hypothetical protein